MIQKVGSSRLGALIFSHTLHYFDRVLLRLTNKTITLTNSLSGLPVVVLTATGAKSGLLRIVPLLCIRDESGSGEIALIASNWGQKHHPGWYYNLIANPEATCSIGGQVGDYIAHEASDEEYVKFWQAAVDTYSGFTQYQERAGDRHMPIVVMKPIGE